MTYYIADMAVFGHVMGAYTEWGSEKHHGVYESYVNARTSDYEDDFNVFLSFNGVLDIVSAYDAAIQVAYQTTFDANGIRNASWMDQNYDWNDPAFKNRCCESLNLALNCVTGVLHTLYLDAIDHKPKPTSIPNTTPTIMPLPTITPQPTPTLPSTEPKWRDQYGVWVVMIIVTVVAVAILVYIRKRRSG